MHDDMVERVAAPAPPASESIDDDVGTNGWCRACKGTGRAGPSESIVRADRDAVIEECAKIADRYAEVPASGPINNTPEAFKNGMDHYAGAVDNASCIAEAIRALTSPAEQGKK